MGGVFVSGRWRHTRTDEKWVILRTILLYCLYTGGAGLGPFVHTKRRQIQQAMNNLCPGYKLETFDFAAAQ